MSLNNNDAGFYLTKKQVSISIAICTILLICFFITGYFMGQKSAVKEFTDKVINDSFADQVNYSLYSRYTGNVDNSENSESNSESNDASEEEAYASDETSDNGSSANSGDAANKTEAQVINLPGAKLPDSGQISGGTRYYAELVGFGSLRSAEQFVKKVQKKGYTVFVKYRKSKTARGNPVVWYQAVTDVFDDKAKLIELTDKIKAAERIQDVKIVTI